MKERKDKLTIVKKGPVSTTFCEHKKIPEGLRKQNMYLGMIYTADPPQTPVEPIPSETLPTTS
jgi:hypothetical protein